MFGKLKERVMSHRVIARWLKRDSYKTQEATDIERKEMQEALGMTERELELLKLVESTAENLHNEAMLTERKILNLAAKMQITKRHIDAEVILGQHTAVLETAIKRIGKKKIVDLGLGERDKLREILSDLHKELTGLLAEAAEIKKEAETEKTAGTELFAALLEQSERVAAIGKAYTRIKKGAKKVIEALGEIETDSGKVSLSTVDIQTRLDTELKKFRQKVA